MDFKQLSSAVEAYWKFALGFVIIVGLLLLAGGLWLELAAADEALAAVKAAASGATPAPSTSSWKAKVGESLQAFAYGVIVTVGGGIWVRYSLVQLLLEKVEGHTAATVAAVGTAETVRMHGLQSIQHVFSEEAAVERLLKSRSAVVVAMRSRTLFSRYHERIGKWLTDGGRLTLILTNPDTPHIDALAARFTASQSSDVKQSLRYVFDAFIKGTLYQSLGADARGRLAVRLLDQPLMYSVYVFDDEELWYVPFHMRRDRKPLPCFVYGKNGQADLWMDVRAVVKDYSKVVDLAK